jgi:phage major head subunit gpT-like protein
MELTPSAASSLYTKFSQIFQVAVEQTEIFWPKFAQLFNSTTESENHVWLDRVPQLRLWVGDRMIQNASLRSYTLSNSAYELTEELDEFAVKDNKIDAFQPLVQLMGQQTKKWPDGLFFNNSTGAIVNGATTLTYDGQDFWSTSHPTNPDNPLSATQSNFASSTPLNIANYFTARAAMSNFLGADGLPLYVTPTLLMVPPSLEATARQILNTTYIAPAVALGMNSSGVMQENPLRGTADLLVVPDMAAITSVGGHAGTPWILMDNTKPIKPFLFQLREAPEFVFNIRPDSPSVFSRHALQYGVMTRGAGGYGPYFYAYLGIG